MNRTVSCAHADAPPQYRLAVRQAVALTFDDGPDPRHTGALLDLLAAAGAAASFFLIGRQAECHPDLVWRILAEGHSIGNHGWGHQHPWWQRAADARRDLATGAAVLTALMGRPPRYYRPPHGRLRACLQAEARAHGQRIVLWTRSGVDWGPFATPAAVARRLRSVGTGDIVLLHDGRNRHNRPEVTLQVLPALLERLQQQGIATLNLDQAQAQARDVANAG